MTEKKNYCVDGKCTVFYFPDCTKRLSFNSGGPYATGCYYCKVDGSCQSESANAEWRKTNGTDN